MTQAEYDVVIIGGGSTGENVAWYAIDNGLTAVIVEDELVGGECSYWACMPSKALLRPGEVLEAVRRVPAAAAAIDGDIDLEKVFELRDAFTSHWDDKHQVAWMDSIGADLVRGKGRISGEREITVAQEDGSSVALTATKGVVVATGSLASFPPIDGLDDTEIWDNRGITSAKSVPERLLIIGGGVVGAEMAQAFKWLGSREVTIVELFDRIFVREEPFVGELMKEVFEDMGITVLTGAKTTGISREGTDGPVTATLEDGTELVADEVLVSTGRRPATDDIGLDVVGLEPGSWLTTDDQLRVEGVDGGWLYAAGDVTNRALLTHQGKYQARILGDVLAGKDVSAWADNKAVPRVAFTDPQVAAVGLTEEQAREQGINLRVLDASPTRVAGANLLGKGLKGGSKVLVDEDRQVIVGATFVGPHVGELLHSATVAIVGEVPLDTLWHAVPSYPTVSEVWLRLLEQYRGLP